MGCFRACPLDSGTLERSFSPVSVARSKFPCNYWIPLNAIHRSFTRIKPSVAIATVVCGFARSRRYGCGTGRRPCSTTDAWHVACACANVRNRRRNTAGIWTLPVTLCKIPHRSLAALHLPLPVFSRPGSGNGCRRRSGILGFPTSAKRPSARIMSPGRLRNIAKSIPRKSPLIPHARSLSSISRNISRTWTGRLCRSCRR